MKRTLCACGIGLAVALLAAAPYAQPNELDRAAARALAESAQDAFERKDFAMAEDLFKRADALVHVPTLMLGVARSQAAQGDLVRAYETYTRLVEERLPEKAPKVLTRAMSDGRKERVGIENKLGFVVTSVVGPSEVMITMDGHALPLNPHGKYAVLPGDHIVVASAYGYRPNERAVSVQKGATVDIDFLLLKDEIDPPRKTLAAEPPNISEKSETVIFPAPVIESPQAAPWREKEPPRDAWMMWGHVAIGAGVAATAVLVVAESVAIAERAELRKNCIEGICGPDQRGRVALHGEMSGLGIGAGALAMSTLSLGTWSLTRKDRSSESSWQRGVGASLLGFGGASLVFAGASAILRATAPDPSGCVGNACDSEREQVRALSRFAIGSGAAALLTIASGAVLSIGAPTRVSAVRTGEIQATVFVSPQGGMGLVGRF